MSFWSHDSRKVSVVGCVSKDVPKVGFVKRVAKAFIGD